MLSSVVKLFVSGAVVVLVCCASLSSADAAVFRDRTAFNAASQNLNTIDFESVVVFIPEDRTFMEIDGVLFNPTPSIEIQTELNGNKLLFSRGQGEFTSLQIVLPPGTTAVGLDQLSPHITVSTSTGESITMIPSDNSTFVGFVSDQPIVFLRFFVTNPAPTPPIFVDNVSFGQRRAGNEPPVPQLLVPDNGRAAALHSVTTTSEPFRVLASHVLSTDDRTRITLFVVGVLLTPADLPFVTVQAEDTQQRVFDLPCESTRRVKNFSWMSQVTVRLPDALVGAGELNVSVNVRGKVSNKAPLRIE